MNHETTKAEELKAKLSDAAATDSYLGKDPYYGMPIGSGFDDVMQKMHDATVEEAIVLGRNPGDGVVRIFADGSGFDDDTYKTYRYLLDFPRTAQGELLIDLELTLKEDYDTEE